MVKKVFTNTYVIVAIVIFVLLFAILLWTETPVLEALGASIVLALVGVAVQWWRETF